MIIVTSSMTKYLYFTDMLPLIDSLAMYHDINFRSSCCFPIDYGSWK